jgi:hypothetical protein
MQRIFVMLFHISIPASNPERVARAIAELWRGEAFPFLPLAGNGSWVAFAGDERGSGIECYPRGARISPSNEAYPTGFTVTVDETLASETGEQAGRIATHAAIYTPLAKDEVIELAGREGWLGRVAQRGRFHVVEFWLENVVMLEVLPEDFKQEYLASQTLEGWRAGAAALARRQPG